MAQPMAQELAALPSRELIPQTLGIEHVLPHHLQRCRSAHLRRDYEHHP